ncbi:EAL domain-containing protein [Marinimicrobium sp. ABcell2]|uniref:EAL domain-containing response regulator n=1 Tax=Marinimicrobium sp. ABcell2 TaxID=3069751 RepID=UPI0027B42A9A|nr:EAL domain-containing protein [Marinimicrobium sp. ABcell2]MDQ2076472.1 EAL domain-containing protein [Marinimicrobium sp. ABcell2]
MDANETVRLLILNDSRTEAERLISMLHNAGRPNRAQHVTSEEVLAKLLQEQAWDLLIGHDQTSNVTPATAVKQIRRLNRDVPVLLLTDDETGAAVVDGLKIGACDVIPLDQDQHLLLAIQRELQNREQRQLRRLAERRFREAERRSQHLLDSSRDAIAYVQDGLYLYANESFAELFGYADRDDIDCLPIMDMVDEKDQKSLKNFLKDFTLKGEEAESTKLEFTGVKHGGGTTPISLEVARATFDEEPCIQFLARANQAAEQSEELVAQIKEIKWQDLATGLYNRQYLVDRLEKLVDAEPGDGHESSLVYIDMDNYAEQVQASFGVAGADMALVDLAALLRAQAQEGDLLARFGDSTFTLLMHNIKADAAVLRAEKLCKVIEDHIVDVDGKTLQITASIGLSLINDTTTSAEAAIDQAVNAMEKARAEHGGNAARLYEPEMTEDEKQERDIASEVQHALDSDRFRLLFQPIISLRGSEEEYYEVLLRMLNDQDEEVSPKEFLETANKMGVGGKIDRWVILESIKMLSQHREKGNKTKLIVNLSRESLCDESLPPWLGVAFKAAKLSSDSIVFQANEVDITNHLNAAKAFAQSLKGLKTKMAISGFGCSLNPFNVFKHVELSFVKVDGSFTQDIQDNNEKPETLINLIKDLHAENVTTIVPFVENASVLATLWQAGVHYIQGYYLQEPSASMSYDFNMET